MAKEIICMMLVFPFAIITKFHIKLRYNLHYKRIPKNHGGLYIYLHYFFKTIY